MKLNPSKYARTPHDFTNKHSFIQSKNKLAMHVVTLLLNKLPARANILALYLVKNCHGKST